MFCKNTITLDYSSRTQHLSLETISRLHLTGLNTNLSTNACAGTCSKLNVFIWNSFRTKTATTNTYKQGMKHAQPDTKKSYWHFTEANSDFI